MQISNAARNPRPKDSKIFHISTHPQDAEGAQICVFKAFLGLSDVSTNLATFFTLVDDHPLWPALTMTWMFTPFVIHACSCFPLQLGSFGLEYHLLSRISKSKRKTGTTNYTTYGKHGSDEGQQETVKNTTHAPELVICL